MAAIADITLADSVPANHTFAPAARQDGLVVYHDRSGGITLGYLEVSLGNRLPSMGNRNHKVTLKIKHPVLETAATAASGFTPGPTIAYTLTCNMNFVIPDRAAALEKADLHAYAKNLLANTVVEDLVTTAIFPH